MDWHDFCKFATEMHLNQKSVTGLNIWNSDATIWLKRCKKN